MERLERLRRRLLPTRRCALPDGSRSRSLPRWALRRVGRVGASAAEVTERRSRPSSVSTSKTCLSFAAAAASQLSGPGARAQARELLDLARHQGYRRDELVHLIE